MGTDDLTSRPPRGWSSGCPEPMLAAGGEGTPHPALRATLPDFGEGLRRDWNIPPRLRGGCRPKDGGWGSHDGQGAIMGCRLRGNDEGGATPVPGSSLRARDDRLEGCDFERILYLG
jgi:hypothetical protein